MLTCNLIQVCQKLQMVEVLADATSIHLFFQNLGSVIRRIEAVVEVHNAHDFVFLGQQTSKIHGFLNFKRFTLFVCGIVVAGNRVPILTLGGVTDENFLKNGG